MAQLDGDQLALVSPSNGAVTANEENKAGVAVVSLLRLYYALFFSRQRSDGAARNQTDGPREPHGGGTGLGEHPSLAALTPSFLGGQDLARCVHNRTKQLRLLYVP